MFSKWTLSDNLMFPNSQAISDIFYDTFRVPNKNTKKSLFSVILELDKNGGSRDILLSHSDILPRSLRSHLAPKNKSHIPILEFYILHFALTVKRDSVLKDQNNERGSSMTWGENFDQIMNYEHIGYQPYARLLKRYIFECMDIMNKKSSNNISDAQADHIISVFAAVFTSTPVVLAEHNYFNTNKFEMVTPAQLFSLAMLAQLWYHRKRVCILFVAYIFERYACFNSFSEYVF